MGTIEKALREALSRAEDAAVLADASITDELQEVFDHHEFGTPVSETWSDAARAASIAARRMRAKHPGAPSSAWKRAAVDAYLRSAKGKAAAMKSARKAAKRVEDVHKGISGLLTPEQRKAVSRAYSRQDAKQRRLTVGRTYGSPTANAIARKTGMSTMYAPRRRRPAS